MVSVIQNLSDTCVYNEALKYYHDNKNEGTYRSFSHPGVALVLIIRQMLWYQYITSLPFFGKRRDRLRIVVILLPTSVGNTIRLASSNGTQQIMVA